MASAKDGVNEQDVGQPRRTSGPHETVIAASSVRSTFEHSLTDVKPAVKTQMSDAAKTNTVSARSRVAPAQMASTCKSQSLDDPAPRRTRATPAVGVKNHGSASDLWRSIKKGGQKLLPSRGSYRHPSTAGRGERKCRKIITAAPPALHKMVQGHVVGDGAEREIPPGLQEAERGKGKCSTRLNKKVCLVHVDGYRYKIGNVFLASYVSHYGHWGLHRMWWV